MPIFIDTRGMSTISIAICDRCKMKRPHAEMSMDFNFPGLRVCAQGCKDEKDPYRLAARKTERINIRFPRPDTNIDVIPDAIQTSGSVQLDLSPIPNTQTPSTNGNLDTLSPTPPQNQ
jgi:hypothetical protein